MLDRYRTHLVRSVLCYRTHHKLACDALSHLESPAGRRLGSLLIGNDASWLTGLTDPDDRFRDFQNHVVHVDEGYWGGAPRVAHRWLDRLLDHLTHRRFSQAAYATGVLSHYFLDTLHPLHTQQCEQGRVVEFPIKHFTAQAYETINQYWHHNGMRVIFELSASETWLGEAMLHGARLASGHYRTLVDDFDPRMLLSKSTNSHETPLIRANVTAHDCKGSVLASLAETLALCQVGLARVLDRVATEAEAISGEIRSTTSPFSLASFPFRIMINHFRKRRWQSQQSQRLQRLLTELAQTGKVEKYLPDEVAVIRAVIQVRHDEQRWQQRWQSAIDSAKTAPLSHRPRRAA